MGPPTAAGSEPGSPPRPAGRRKWLAAASGLLLTALLALWLLWPEPAARQGGPPPPEGPGPTAPLATQPRPRPVPAPSREEPGGPGAAPIIDEISVEKKEVCEGEENLVTVKAHTPDGTDAFLHTMVGSTPGQSVPLRTWLADDGEQPRLEVKVFGKNGVATTAPLPEFLVKSCRPAHTISIVPHLKANTFGEYVFEAKIVQPPPLDPEQKPATPFKARSYEWTFGDGDTATTAQPFAEHGYESRRQDRMFSDFIVQVTARGERGESVTGRTALQLLNPAFEDLAAKGVVTLMARFTPRFPELGADGVVRQKVRLFHFRDRPVYIHGAVVFRHRQDPTATVIPSREDPFAVLGGNIIPPGHGIDFEARLDTRKEPDIFSLEYTLEGKDSEGLPVRGAFSVMRPPPRPTKENSTPVLDPVLKQKILAARRILNREVVTDEDLLRLEREGKFADLPPLRPPPPPPSGAEPPAKDPGPPPPGPTGVGGEKLTGHDRKQ